MRFITRMLHAGIGTVVLAVVISNTAFTCDIKMKNMKFLLWVWLFNAHLQ